MYDISLWWINVDNLSTIYHPTYQPTTGNLNFQTFLICSLVSRWNHFVGKQWFWPQVVNLVRAKRGFPEPSWGFLHRDFLQLFIERHWLKHICNCAISTCTIALVHAIVIWIKPKKGGSYMQRVLFWALLKVFFSQ